MATRSIPVEISEQLYERFYQEVSTKWKGSRETYARALQSAVKAALTQFLDSLEENDLNLDMMSKAFVIGNTTKQTVRRLASYLLHLGEINLDYGDLMSVLCQEGRTIISSGIGAGQNRAIKACEAALANHLAATPATKATGKALFHLTGPDDLLLGEVNDAVSMVKKALAPPDGLIFGVARDGKLIDKVRIVIFATHSHQYNAINRNAQ